MLTLGAASVEGDTLDIVDTVTAVTVTEVPVGAGVMAVCEPAVTVILDIAS